MEKWKFLGMKGGLYILQCPVCRTEKSVMQLTYWNPNRCYSCKAPLLYPRIKIKRS